MKNRIISYFTIPIKFLWSILGFLSALMMAFFGYLEGTSPADTLKLCVLAFILISIIAFFVRTVPLDIHEKPFFTSILIGFYMLSLILTMLTKEYSEIHVWMLGGLIIAMLFDMQLGLIFTYNLTFFASFNGNLSIEFVVYLLIIGSLMCLLAESVKKLATIGYVIIIILSVQITLLFVIHNFNLWESVNINALYSVLSSLLIICLSYGVHYLYQKKIMNHIDVEAAALESNYFAMEQNDINETQEDELLPVGTHSFDEILQLDFPLLQRLKEHSQKLYNQSIMIGDIAENAAKSIGINEKVAKAGGLYHEIGRIVSSQYVEEGVKLIEDYHLPKIVGDIIRQHNLKLEKPQTPEAAVVMLTFSIITMKEYIEKQGLSDKSAQNGHTAVSIEKIVDNVFQMRLAKRSLDDSGLTLVQFNTLKEFYLHM